MYLASTVQPSNLLLLLSLPHSTAYSDRLILFDWRLVRLAVAPSTIVPLFAWSGLAARRNYLLNCDKSFPSWNEEWSCEENWPVADFFEWEMWLEKDQYMRVVREEENEDFEGTKGHYHLREVMFTMVILCTYTSDEDLKAFTDLIPCQDEFCKLMVADSEEAMEAMKAAKESQDANLGGIKIKIEQFKDYSCGKTAMMPDYDRCVKK